MSVRKNLVLLLVLLSSIFTMISCKDTEEVQPVDVRLCCYMEFIGAFGNDVENEVKKVVDNVNSRWIWNSPANSPAADSISFGDNDLRFDAKRFAEEFRSCNDSTEKIVCLTTYEIFDRPKPDSLVIVHGITYPNNLGSVVSVAAIPESDNYVLDYTRLILHELAHQYGLKDCNNARCMMHDHADSRWIGNCKKFCPDCKKQLAVIGWHLEEW